MAPPLNGFRAAVGKKYPAQAAGLHQLSPGFHGRHIVIEIGRMQQACRSDFSVLPHNPDRRTPSGTHRNACAEIQIFVAVHHHRAARPRRDPAPQGKRL